jgi:hypothetical protein
VQEIVDLVDEDGSNQIEFGEFLSIIKGGSNAVSVIYHNNYRKNRKSQLKLKELMLVQSTNSSRN